MPVFIIVVAAALALVAAFVMALEFSLGPVFG
jgi:hypothetical protein